MAYIIPNQVHKQNNDSLNSNSNNTNNNIFNSIFNEANNEQNTYNNELNQNNTVNSINNNIQNTNNSQDNNMQSEETIKIQQQYKIQQAMNKRADEILMQQKNDLINLIFDGYTLTTVTYKGFKIVIRSVAPEEADKAYHDASFYDEDFFYAAYRLFILSIAIQSINDYSFSNQQECYNFLKQLSLKVISNIYDLFIDNIEYQNFLVANMDSLYKLVEDSFCRIKYKVMRAFNCLPTEERCKKMGDAQWLWLYYNIQEDLMEEFDNTQDNLDYIGFYINSDAAKQITKNSAAKRKKRLQQRKKKFQQITERDRKYIISKLNNTDININEPQSQSNTNQSKNTQNNTDKSIDNNIPQQEQELQQENKADQILDHFLNTSDEMSSNDNTVYNSDFERELAAALGTTDISEVTEISDDHSAGDPFESEEDFIERVMAFLPVAGTSYGYVKPEKPKKVHVKRINTRSPRPNLAPGEYIPEYDEKDTNNDKLQKNINALMNSNPTIPKVNKIK